MGADAVCEHGDGFGFEDLTFDHLCCGDRERRLFEQATSSFDPAIGTYLLGVVAKLDRSYPLVVTERGTFRTEYAADLRKRALSLAAVGDWVVLVTPEGQDMPLIVTILERRCVLARRDGTHGARGSRSNEQVLAANIDTILLLAPLSGEGVDIRHVERMLVVAHESGAQPVIVLSKADRAVALERDLAAVRLRAGAVPVILESGKDGRGIEEIRALLPKGSIAVLLGKSGVGKSTLVNALAGAEVQDTKMVRSQDGKGRHTTVAREMIAIPGGGIIIDTPGLRSLSIWDVVSGIDRAYADVLGFADTCRFRDCTHQGEPGCGLVAAVADGRLPAYRLESYRALAAEAAEAAKVAEAASWRS